MYSGFLARAGEGVEAVKRHLATSEALRLALSDGRAACAATTPCFVGAGFADPPDFVQWRVIDHCSAVSRLYGIYEQFAHELVKEYLSFLERSGSFSELKPSVLSAYRLGMSKLISRIDWNRYGSLTLEGLIEDYSGALSGNSIYRIEPEAFLTHERNLQLDDLNGIFKTCGVAGVTEWLENHARMQEFFSEEERLGANVASELKLFVEARNEVAHGALTVDNIAGTVVLNEYADFVLVLCNVLAEKIQLEVLLEGERRGIATRHGVVKELLKEKTVLIGDFVGPVAAGGAGYLLGEGYCVEISIVSIQDNGNSVEEYLESTPKELGLLISPSGKKKCALLSIRAPERNLAPDDQASSAEAELESVAADDVSEYDLEPEASVEDDSGDTVP